MVLYNMSFMDNSTNVVELMTGIGEAMGQPYLIGWLTLLSFFIIFFILSVRHSPNEVIIIDCFITTILAILFYFGGLVNAVTIAFPAVLFFITLIFYLFNNKWG